MKLKCPEVNVGDVVILRSQYYNVSQCKAVVCRIRKDTCVTIEFEIIDKTKFNHGHFRMHGKHWQVAGDEWSPLPREFFKEDLFTI